MTARRDIKERRENEETTGKRNKTKDQKKENFETAVKRRTYGKNKQEVRKRREKQQKTTKIIQKDQRID